MTWQRTVTLQNYQLDSGGEMDPGTKYEVYQCVSHDALPHAPDSETTSRYVPSLAQAVFAVAGREHVVCTSDTLSGVLRARQHAVGAVGDAIRLVPVADPALVLREGHRLHVPAIHVSSEAPNTLSERGVDKNDERARYRFEVDTDRYRAAVEVKCVDTSRSRVRQLHETYYITDTYTATTHAAPDGDLSELAYGNPTLSEFAGMALPFRVRVNTVLFALLTFCILLALAVYPIALPVSFWAWVCVLPAYCYIGGRLIHQQPPCLVVLPRAVDVDRLANALSCATDREKTDELRRYLDAHAVTSLRQLRDKPSADLPLSEDSLEPVSQGVEAVIESVHSAATVLRRESRDVDAAALTDLAGCIDKLPVRDQADVATAAQRVSDAYRVLNALPQHRRDLAGSHGQPSPTEDAAAVVDAAVAYLKRALAAASDPDVDALRALRRYSEDRWGGTDGDLVL